MILAFDGAWRAGYDSESVCTALEVKQTVNEQREFPPAPEDEPSFHVHTDDNEMDVTRFPMRHPPP